MTEIGLVPLKSIIIGEITEYSPEELADYMNNAPLFWTDGYLFSALAAPPEIFGKALFEEQTLLLIQFIYAKFPTYQNEIKNRHKQPIIVLHDKSIHPKMILQYIKDKK